MNHFDNWNERLKYDQEHIWHPYAKLPNPIAAIGVKKTQGSLITLATDREVVDGMSSWWAALHGYNHPKIQQAMHEQIDTMPHIMFGGLAHEGAAKLSKLLVDLTGLNSVFLCDSGSVSVEVALKTAILSLCPMPKMGRIAGN